MKLPVYSRNRLACWTEVDEDVATEAIEFLWRLTSHGYVARKSLGQPYLYLHRMVLGIEDNRIEADHIDGDRLNNRRSNLRAVSHAQNMQNQRPQQGRSSQHRGVSLTRAGRWLAQAKSAGQYFYLGLYDTEDDAATAATAFRARHMPFSSDAHELAVDVVDEQKENA